MLIVQIILLLRVLTLLLPGGLNYKLLMNGEDPLSILIPVLTSTNVHMVSKLANKVPCTECGFLSPGMVFSAYSEKLFWQGDGKHPHPKSTVSCAHQNASPLFPEHDVLLMSRNMYTGHPV